MKSIQHDDESHEDELSSKQAENWRGQVVNSQAIVMMSEIHVQIGVQVLKITNVRKRTIT